MGNTSYREGRITNLRAFAILMVVFGHSIILYSSRWNLYTTNYEVPVLDWIKDGINCMQMPLFFSLSGYLFYGKGNKTVGLDYIKGKVRRLLVPFVFIGLCWLLPVRLLVDYPGYRGKDLVEILIKCIFLGYDDGHLWYLPCLFGCFCVDILLSNVLRCATTSHWVRLITGMFAALFLHTMAGELSVPVLRNLSTYWLWFVMGGILKMADSPMRCLKVGAVLIPVVGVWMFLEKHSAIMTMFWLVCLYCLMPRKSCKVTEMLSEYSFGLYLLHSPLIYITFTYCANWPPLAVILLNFAGFGGLAILLTMLLKKTPLRILIGENYTPKRRRNEVQS